MSLHPQHGPFIQQWSGGNEGLGSQYMSGLKQLKGFFFFNRVVKLKVYTGSVITHTGSLGLFSGACRTDKEGRCSLRRTKLLLSEETLKQQLCAWPKKKKREKLVNKFKIAAGIYLSTESVNNLSTPSMNTSPPSHLIQNNRTNEEAHLLAISSSVTFA